MAQDIVLDMQHMEESKFPYKMGTYKIHGRKQVSLQNGNI
jgi:hypothetical protein